MTTTQAPASDLLDLQADDSDPYDVGTCAACGELPFGHDNFGCTGRGHASKVNDCTTCDEWDTNCPHGL